MKPITHVLAVVVGALYAVYQYPGVSQAIATFFSYHPHIASTVTAALALLALYHKPQK